MGTEQGKSDNYSRGYPPRTSKALSLAEAGKIVADCQVVSLSGSTLANTPMALIREAIRAGAKGLTIIPPVASGIGCDLLIAAGCVNTIYISYIFRTLGWNRS